MLEGFDSKGARRLTIIDNPIRVVEVYAVVRVREHMDIVILNPSQV